MVVNIKVLIYCAFFVEKANTHYLRIKCVLQVHHENNAYCVRIKGVLGKYASAHLQHRYCPMCVQPPSALTVTYIVSLPPGGSRYILYAASSLDRFYKRGPFMSLMRGKIILHLQLTTPGKGAVTLPDLVHLFSCYPVHIQRM